MTFSLFSGSSMRRKKRNYSLQNHLEMENKMTPTPWEVDGYDMLSIIHDESQDECFPAWKHICKCNYGYEQPLEHFEGNKANAAAIVSAVNNTWGAGINPTGIPVLIEAITGVLMDEMWNDISFSSKTLIKCALEAIKL
jgi:hypothetical protein